MKIDRILCAVCILQMYLHMYLDLDIYMKCISNVGTYV